MGWKSSRTPWTEGEKKEFIEWHELAIASYPKEAQQEMRAYRQNMLNSIRIIKNENSVSQRSPS